MASLLGLGAAVAATVAAGVAAGAVVGTTVGGGVDAEEQPTTRAPTAREARMPLTDLFNVRCRLSLNDGVARARAGQCPDKMS
jgi:hypothetical protein